MGRALQDGQLLLTEEILKVPVTNKSSEGNRKQEHSRTKRPSEDLKRKKDTFGKWRGRPFSWKGRARKPPTLRERKVNAPNKMSFSEGREGQKKACLGMLKRKELSENKFNSCPNAGK